MRSKEITGDPSNPADMDKRAGARAFFWATGWKQDDFKKPIISVACPWTNGTPCNHHFRQLGERETSVLEFHREIFPHLPLCATAKRDSDISRFPPHGAHVVLPTWEHASSIKFTAQLQQLTLSIHAFRLCMCLPVSVWLCSAKGMQMPERISCASYIHPVLHITNHHQ